MRKLLVIRLSSLGDVVLTLPVYKTLRDAYPGAHIAALVKESFADVLKGEPAIDEVITLSKGESLWSLCRRVRAGRFGAVLDLHANARSRVICLFSGAATIVRYHKDTFARRLFVAWRFGSETLKQHTLDRYLEAASRLTPERGIVFAGQPANILVIQTAFLGDAVLTTPLLGALHDKFPDSRLSVLCTPEIAEVFEHHPAVSHTIVFDKRAKDRSLWSRWTLIQRIKSEHYDVAVIPHRSVTSALLAYLAGIPRRIGFSASQGRWFLTDVVTFQWGVHDVDRNLALLKVLGVKDPAGDLWLKPDEETARRVEMKLMSAGVEPQDLLIGINPGSMWATKRWLPEGFAAVADRLMRDVGAKVVFIGGPKDRETMRQVSSFMKEKPVDWVGETTLKELIAAIARCRVFLTNDSGPLHIAVASRVPTVAIFGATTKELGFFPYGPGHHVIEKDLPCRPCGLHGGDRCPLGHFQCMKLITADEVFEAVKDKIA